jgi:hypothetical protein
MLHSTEYLRILDQHDCHLLLERGVAVGRLKSDVLSLIASDGRPLPIQTPQGWRGYAQPPRAVLDDFLAARFVAQDGPADEEGRSIYRLTDDGRKAARGVQ